MYLLDATDSVFRWIMISFIRHFRAFYFALQRCASQAWLQASWLAFYCCIFSLNTTLKICSDLPSLDIAISKHLLLWCWQHKGCYFPQRVNYSKCWAFLVQTDHEQLAFHPMPFSWHSWQIFNIFHFSLQGFFYTVLPPGSSHLSTLASSQVCLVILDTRSMSGFSFVSTISGRFLAAFWDALISLNLQMSRYPSFHQCLLSDLVSQTCLMTLPLHLFSFLDPVCQPLRPKLDYASTCICPELVPFSKTIWLLLLLQSLQLGCSAMFQVCSFAGYILPRNSSSCPVL